MPNINNKTNKSAKAAGKTILAKSSKDVPVLRAIKGGKAAPPKPGPAKPAVKPVPAAVADDVPVIALNLAPAKLSPAMAAYFKKCQDRLGFVPNVLLAYAFDMTKLETFVAMYNDLMLGDSGVSKLEREMIAVAVSSQNPCYFSPADGGPAASRYSSNPLLGERQGRHDRLARLG